MCGACGRTVTADPVFPAGRTTRGNLIAGQIVDRLCASVPGRVRVTGRADGFAVSAPGRQRVPCATIGAVWAVVLAAAPGVVAVLSSVPADVRAHYRQESLLLNEIVAAGRLLSTSPLPPA